MARPIKETPILFGEDARRFESRMSENHKVSKEEKARIFHNYKIALAMLKKGENITMQTSNEK
ncbi:MAG: hypothetical protein MJ198_00700 [Bacteroidales bacterium]|nr:hypothetical protein [Bacteroidales bacterium]